MIVEDIEARLSVDFGRVTADALTTCLDSKTLDFRSTASIPYRFVISHVCHIQHHGSSHQ